MLLKEKGAEWLGLCSATTRIGVLEPSGCSIFCAVGFATTALSLELLGMCGHIWFGHSLSSQHGLVTKAGTKPHGRVGSLSVCGSALGPWFGEHGGVGSWLDVMIVVVFSDFNRIIEWLGLGGTSKISSDFMIPCAIAVAAWMVFGAGEHCVCMQSSCQGLRMGWRSHQEMVPIWYQDSREPTGQRRRSAPRWLTSVWEGTKPMFGVYMYGSQDRLLPLPVRLWGLQSIHWGGLLRAELCLEDAALLTLSSRSQKLSRASSLLSASLSLILGSQGG